MKRLLLLFILTSSWGGGVRAEVSEDVTKYHELLLKKPDNETVYQRFVDAWLAEGDRDQLQTWLTENARSGGAKDWRILTKFHEEMGEDGLALWSLDRAVELVGEDLPLRLSRAKLRAKKDDLDGAITDLDLVIVDETLGREASRLKGACLARIGRIQEATKIWKDLLARFPDDEDLREDLIEMQIEEGLLEQAIEASLALIKGTKDPYKKALRQLRLAEVFGSTEDRENQLATYDEVLKSSGEGTWLEGEVLSQIEQIHLREDDVQGLRNYYQKLRETYPQRTSIRKALAMQMARNGELKEAIALFREVLKVTPGDFGNREEFITLLEVHEKWEEALAELRELIQVKGDDPLLWERVLGAEANLKNRDGMLAALSKMREMKSTTADEIIAVAALYRQHGFVEEAENVLRTGRGQFAESNELMKTLADLLAGRDQAEEALKLWLAAAEGGREDTLSVVRSLTGHKMTGEAFQLLLRKVRASPDDRVLATQLGRYAQTPEQASAATSHLLTLVKSSKSPTEMEEAITLAASVILRSKKDREVVGILEKRELAPPLQCLLAELEAATGDLIKANLVLDEAGDDLRTKFFRVRFAERNGELSSAIALLEEVLDDPKSRKTVHLRRLVALYERAGKLPAALQCADEWKRTSPGDRQAWLTKARLLTEAGRFDEAMADYRRLLGKFGEEDDRAKLAETLEKGGRFFEAGTQYRKLYESAKDRKARLEWINQWGKMMARIDRKEEVFKVLQKRSQSNRRSAEPFIALAQLYQEWKEPGKRREALLEAVRRQPKDWELLHRLADEVEREGRVEDAIALLMEAARVEKGTVSKEALADLLIRNGEVEKGVEILQSIPGHLNNPREVEGAVESLGWANQLDAATRYLKDVLQQHPEDWRLEYLYALLRLQAGEEKEAAEIFCSLDRVVPRLVNIPLPTLKGIHSRPLSDLAGMPPESVRLSRLHDLMGKPGVRDSDDLLSSQRSSVPSRRNPQTPLYDLPHSPENLRDLAFLRYSRLLAERKENDREAFRNLVKTATAARKIFLLSRYDFAAYLDFVREELVKDPESVELSKMWLVRQDGREQEFPKVTERAFRVLREKAPLEFFLNPALLHGAGPFQNKKWLELHREIYHGLSSADQLSAHGRLAGMIAQISDNQKNQSAPSPDDESFRKFVREELLKRKAPLPSPWIYGNELLELLREGNGPDAVGLLNHLIEKGTLTRSGSINRRRGRSWLDLPKLPRLQIGPWLNLAQLKSEQQKYRKTGADRASQLALLRELSNEKNLVQRVPHDPLTVLADHVDDIAHPFYRALVLLALDEHAKLSELVTVMAASNEPDQLRFAAAFQAGQGKHLSAYQCLEKILNSGGKIAQRETVEGSLVFLAGGILTVEEKKEIDLKRVQEILIRLSSLGMTGATPELYRNLELPDQASRLERIEKSRSLRQKQSSQTRSQRPTRPIGGNLIKAELAADNPAIAVAEVTKILRSYRSQKTLPSQVDEVISLFSKPAHIDLLLAALQPDGRANAWDWRTFATVARVLKREEVAREALEKLLKLTPDDHQARIELFLLCEDEQRDWSIFSPKNNSESARQLGEVLSFRFRSSSPKSYDLIMTTLKAAQSALGGLEVAPSAPSTTSWISRLLQDAADAYKYGGFQTPHLRSVSAVRTGHIPFDAEKSKELKRAFRALFFKMLNSPRFSDRGFAYLLSGSMQMELNEDELQRYANQSIAVQVARPYPKLEKQVLPISHFNLNSQIFKSSAFQFLFKRNVDQPEEVFTEESWELLVKNRPLLFQSFEAARALKKAAPAESASLYEKILGDLPGDAEVRKLAFVELSHLIEALDIAPGEWADLHQVELFNHQEQPNSLLAGWAKWVLDNQGREGFSRFFAALCTARLGDSKTWPVLTQLLPENWPVELRGSRSRFILEVLSWLNTPSLVEPLATESRRFGLDGLLPQVKTFYRGMWRGIPFSDGSEFLRILKSEIGLIPMEGDQTVDAARMMTFIDGLRSGWERRMARDPDLHTKLDEDEELDDFWKGLLKVHLKIPFDDAAFLHRYLSIIKKLYQFDPLETGQFFGSWFSRIQATGLQPESRAFLDEVGREIGANAKARLERFIENLDSVQKFFDQNGFWERFAPFASVEPDAAAEIFEDLLRNALAEIDGPASRLKERDSAREGLVRSAVERLVKNLDADPVAVSPLAFIKTIHRLCWSEIGDLMLVPMTTGRMIEAPQTYLMLSHSRAHESSDQDMSPLRSSLEALRPILRDLTPSERKTLIFLLPLDRNQDWASPMVKGVSQDWQWLDTEVRKEFPAVTDFFTAFVSRNPPRDQNKANDYERFAKLESSQLLRFLENEEFPPVLKARAAFQILTGTRLGQHFTTSSHWNWLADGLKISLESSNFNQRAAGLRLMSGLELRSFEKLVNIPDRFLEAVVDSLPSDRFGEEQYPALAQAVEKISSILLAMNCDDLLSQLIANCPEVFERSLALQWQIFEAGQGNHLSGKFDLTSGLADPTGLPHFGKGSPARVGEFVKLFPSGQRYFLEVLFSTAGDLGGEDAPALSQLERMVPLAQRFSKEGPADPRFGHPLLSYFTTNPESSAVVIEALREIEKNHLIGLLDQSGDGEINDSYLRNIILAVIEADLNEGRTDSALRQFRSLLGKVPGRRQSEAMKVVESILYHAFATSTGDPKRAGEFVELADQLFQESLAVTGEEFLPVVVMVQFFVMMQHELAHDGAGWTELVDGLTAPQKRHLHEVKKKYPILSNIYLSNYDRWKSKESLEMRMNLERILLTSESFLATARAHPGLFPQALAHGTFLGWRETLAMLAELPEPYLSEPLYQWMRGHGATTTEDALQRLTRARAVAREGKFIKLEAEVLLDHAHRLHSIDRKEEALRLANEVDLKLIEDPQRKKVIEMIRKTSEK